LLKTAGLGEKVLEMTAALVDELGKQE